MKKKAAFALMALVLLSGCWDSTNIEELKMAIVTTLKDSLNNTNRAINYNSKKIKINRVISG